MELRLRVFNLDRFALFFVLFFLGKVDRLWQTENQIMHSHHSQQNTFDMHKNNVPQITILKRNPSLPINPQDISKVSKNVTRKAVIPNTYDMSFIEITSIVLQRYFHPISSNQPTSNQSTQTNGPVELHITNLDQCMDTAELRKCLFNAFGEYTAVKKCF